MDELNSWISADKQVNILLDSNCVAVTLACGITNKLETGQVFEGDGDIPFIGLLHVYAITQLSTTFCSISSWYPFNIHLGTKS